MSTFVTVLRQSPVFRPEWVTRLNRQAAEHLKPSRIVCLSDVPVSCERIPFVHSWPGWWSKIEAFRPGVAQGPTVLVDLDTLILAPLPRMWEIITEKAGLMMLNDLGRPERAASGVMMWVPSKATERIYHDFAKDQRVGMQTRHGDQGWIGRYPHARLQSFFPSNSFVSYKYGKLEAGPRDTLWTIFHGRPKFNDLDRSLWAHKVWVGANTQGLT